MLQSLRCEDFDRFRQFGPQQNFTFQNIPGQTPCCVPWNVGAVATYDIHPKLILKLKSRKISFFLRIHVRCWIVLKSCAEYGSGNVALCATFQGYLKWSNYLRANDISRDLSQWSVSGGYPILQRAMGIISGIMIIIYYYVSCTGHEGPDGMLFL